MLYFLKFFDNFEQFCASQYVHIPSTDNIDPSSLQSYLRKKWDDLKRTVGYHYHDEKNGGSDKNHHANIGANHNNNENQNTIWL